MSMRQRPVNHFDEEAWPVAAVVDDDDRKYSKRVPAEHRGCGQCSAQQLQSGWTADDIAWWSLLFLGVVTRFYGLEWPRQVVFDEVHFGKFVSGYITGGYFFDIHPPFSKLLIAAVCSWSGYDGSQQFAKIGELYPPGLNLFALRAVPATFGAALVPLTYSLARQIGCSTTAAALVGGMVLLDGGLLVESRLLLTDSLLFFWEMLQLLHAFRASAAPPLSLAYQAHLAATGQGIRVRVRVEGVGVTGDG